MATTAVSKGPTPALSETEVAGYLAQLSALTTKVGHPVPKEPGDDAEVPF
jgi:hypothetical protein